MRGTQAFHARLYGMDIGDRVRVLQHVRPARFAGKVGSVAVLKDDEVGVDFGSDSLAWFFENELESVLV